MLGSMKGVKMSGLSDKMSSIISSLRLGEIASARRYRTMLVYVVVLCKLHSHCSPITNVLTIAFPP
jgi:ATP-binding cassette, subfamily C (CFTR/MRP), member 1